MHKAVSAVFAHRMLRSLRVVGAEGEAAATSLARVPGQVAVELKLRALRPLDHEPNYALLALLVAEAIRMLTGMITVVHIGHGSTLVRLRLPRVAADMLSSLTHSDWLLAFGVKDVRAVDSPHPLMSIGAGPPSVTLFSSKAAAISPSSPLADARKAPRSPLARKGPRPPLVEKENH